MSRLHRIGVEKLHHMFRHICARGDVIPPVLGVQHRRKRILWFADARRDLQDLFEHRVKFVGRARDDRQHVGRGRLIFQRLFNICRAVLQLAELAHVFHRDHRLRGEGLNQRNIVI